MVCFCSRCCCRPPLLAPSLSLTWSSPLWGPRAWWVLRPQDTGGSDSSRTVVCTAPQQRQQQQQGCSSLQCMSAGRDIHSAIYPVVKQLVAQELLQHHCSKGRRRHAHHNQPLLAMGASAAHTNSPAWLAWPCPVCEVKQCAAFTYQSAPPPPTACSCVYRWHTGGYSASS